MRHVQGPDELNRLAWPVVVKPDGNPEEYRVALLRLEEANRMAPGNFSLSDSLGVALYRAGRYQDAVAKLETSDREARLQVRSSLPTTLSFLAMAQARLGRRAEALALLERVGQLATEPIWGQIAESPATRAEAEQVVGSSASTDRERNIRNFQVLGRAIHGYAEDRKALPPPAILAADGRPLLSWRVALLPYLGQKELHDQFHLDEPWDSTHNKTLIARMPAVFGPSNEPGSTHYRVFTGPGTAFPAAGLVDVASIRDGTINTLLVVEATDSVPWTCPEELPFAADRPLASLGIGESGRASLMLANGGVVTFRRDPSAEPILRALITRDGGEPVSLDRLPR